MAIRLIIADDHPIVLNGLEQLFEDYDEFEIVARCIDGEQVLDALHRVDADVVILDIKMPKKDGLAVLRQMKRDKLTTKVVLLTAALNEEEVLEAIRLGAKGVVLKEMAPRLLIECVRKVNAGGQWLEKGSVGKALERLMKREEGMVLARSVLTPRELEIIRMVSTGMRNRMIAEKLFITEGTVKMHLHSVYEKLKVNGRMELMVYAREKGLA
ncbi:MAG: response regulator transcription factor [Thermoanaerobaculia bacterium]